MAFRNKGTVGPTVIVSVEPDRSGNFVCDGVADDVQIQEAIDYVTALGTGGTVLIKAGAYLISTRITIVASFITIRGEAKGWRDGTYLYLVSGSDTEIFHVGDGVNTYENVYFWHMELRGNDAVNEVGIYVDGPRLRNASFKYIEFLNFDNATAHCMEFHDLGRSEIIRCHFMDCAGGHIVATGTGFDTENIYERNKFGVTDNWCIDIGGATSLNRVINNFFEHGATGGSVRITAGDSNIIALNIAHFDGGSNDLDIQTDHNTIIGNYFININSISGNDNIIDGNKLGPTTVSGNDNRWNKSNLISTFTDAGTNNELPWIFMEVTDPDGNVGDHPALVLPDTVDTTFRFQVPIPLEFQQLVTAHVIVVQTATGGPPDMQWSTTTDWGKLCAAENYNAGSDAETDQTTAVTQNNLVCIDVSASLDGIAAGDLVGFTFIRRASQAGDDIDADAYYLGFRLRYV